MILNKSHLTFIALFTLMGTSQVLHASNCVKPRVTGYQYVGCLHDGLASVVTKNDKVGYVNQSGKLVIPAIYEVEYFGEEDEEYAAGNDFSEGLAIVKKSNQTVNGFGEVSGVIDTKGTVVVPFQYDWIGKFSEGLAPVRKGEKWGYIDKSGKFSIPLTSTYTRVGIFSEGLAPVYSYVSNNDDNLKFGYINKTGKLVIPMNFSKPFGGKYDDQKYSFKNGKAHVMNFKGNRFCIDKSGKKVSCK